MNQDEYLTSLFAPEDEVLASINNGLLAKELPLISVPPLTGKLLALLIQISGAKRILEIGALGGYSAIWMARALPEEGQLISIELDSEHLVLAEENVQKAGLSKKVEFLGGEALKCMEELEKANETFDFFFIDADKENYPSYLDKAIALSNSGAIITADNLLFHGRVLDDTDQGPSPTQLRRMNRKLAQDPRLESIIIPIGDGLGVARVKES